MDAEIVMATVMKTARYGLKCTFKIGNKKYVFYEIDPLSIQPPANSCDEKTYPTYKKELLASLYQNDETILRECQKCQEPVRKGHFIKKGG